MSTSQTFMDSLSRRGFLGVGGGLAFAGCIGGGEDPDPPDSPDIMALDDEDDDTTEPAAPEEQAVNEDLEFDEPTEPTTDPESVVVAYLEAWETRDASRINHRLHPEAPTYAVDPTDEAIQFGRNVEYTVYELETGPPEDLLAHESELTGNEVPADVQADMEDFGDTAVSAVEGADYTYVLVGKTIDGAPRLNYYLLLEVDGEWLVFE